MSLVLFAWRGIDGRVYWDCESTHFSVIAVLIFLNRASDIQYALQD